MGEGGNPYFPGLSYLSLFATCPPPIKHWAYAGGGPGWGVREWVGGAPEVKLQEKDLKSC